MLSSRSLLSLVLASSASASLWLLGDLRQNVNISVGLMLGWGLALLYLKPSFGNIYALLGAAILVRLPMLLSLPTLSDDLYRYLWEGRVWNYGYNPFFYPPDSPELIEIRDEIWRRVNHREVSSIYPPLAQLCFRLCSPGGIYAWKLLMGGADLLTTALLFRRRPEAGAFWALLPLPVVESAGSGHLEGLGVMFLVGGLSWGRSLPGAWLLWAGAMVKLLPALLLPRVAAPRSWPWLLLASAMAFATMELDIRLLRGFETYRQHWSFNGSLYPLLQWLGGEAAAVRQLLLGLGLLTVLGILGRSRDPGRIALWCCGAFVLMSPTVHPWYVLWALAAGLWCELNAWVYLAVLVPLAYLVLNSLGANGWQEPEWVRWVIYPPVYLLLLLQGLRRLLLPSPSSVF